MHLGQTTVSRITHQIVFSPVSALSLTHSELSVSQKLENMLKERLYTQTLTREATQHRRSRMASFSISNVSHPKDLVDVTRLFLAYVTSLGIDLTFQDFASEMRSMPGKYSPPTGALLLARSTKRDAIGCVGLRPLSIDGVCEMKRLYVDPQGRGLGVGKALADAVITEAKRLRYQSMRLDTLPNMASAR